MVGVAADKLVVLKITVFWIPVLASVPLVHEKFAEEQVVPVEKLVAAEGFVKSTVAIVDVYIITSSQYSVVEPETLLVLTLQEKFCAEPLVFWIE